MSLDWSLSDILDDLVSRFLLNLPDSELSSTSRLLFQIEQAHWFYLDFHCEKQPTLPRYNLKTFAGECFKRCPMLVDYVGKVDQVYEDFVSYKVRVPVCGAIMVNGRGDKVVLVKGWSARSPWGFPKGKINKDEAEEACAVREVLEETSYDIAPLLKKEDYLELIIREQRIRLYVIMGVPESTEFAPKTRKEISDIAWHPIETLPSVHTPDKLSQYAYYNVSPFVKPLRRFLRRRGQFIGNNLQTGSESETMVTTAMKRSSSYKQPIYEPVHEQQEATATLKALLGVGMESQSHPWLDFQCDREALFQAFRQKL